MPGALELPRAGSGLSSCHHLAHFIGSNTLQNFPLISSAKSDGGKATIKGTLKSSQSGSFTIQFFANSRGAKDEGKKFVGETIVNDGIMPFNTKSARKVKPGLYVTATATDITGNTSEFSAPRKVREQA